MNIFEEASRKAFRFTSAAGLLTVEQLWTLPLTAKSTVDLDHVARSANEQLNAAQEESFVKPQVIGNTELTTKLEIVKYIIAVRQEENKAKTDAVAKAEQKRRLLEVLHEKKQGELQNLTVEEIEKQIAAL